MASEMSPGSVIHVQLTPPSQVPASLRLVHVRLGVEGVLYSRTFEADPKLIFTFRWDGRNAYRQKVYGIATARIYVGYEYLRCFQIVWTSQVTALKGFDLNS